MTAAGCPSAAARFTTRPPASRFSPRPPSSKRSTSGRISRTPRRAARRSASEISTSNCPALASTAPSFIRAKCSPRSTSGTPVTVMKMSPRSAASSAGMTWKPSIRASSARSGSTSQTITDAPKPCGPQRDAAARPAVAEHDDGLPGQQQVGRAHDAVEHRLAGAEAIVERALGARLVDGDDRHRQATLGLQRAQAHQAGGGLLGPAEHPLQAGPAGRRAARRAGRRRRPA